MTGPSRGLQVRLPSGEAVPALGVGTWGYAQRAGRRRDEIAALHGAWDLGLTLVDTAETYAGGQAEELVGEALRGRRDEVFLVGKVHPRHATREGTVLACERSLRRLDTDHLDLYLLHWRGRTPLEETVEGFTALVRAGMVRYWGVGDFGVTDLEDLVATSGGAAVASDRVRYDLLRRGAEVGVLPWCRAAGVPVLAYSPIGDDEAPDDPLLDRVARDSTASPLQVIVAWVLRQPGIGMTIGVRHPTQAGEARAALDLHLTPLDLALLDQAFAPPRRPR